MQTQTVEKDHVIENAEVKLTAAKTDLEWKLEKLSETEALALNGNGSNRPTFVQEVMRRKTEVELKRAYVVRMEKDLADAISDLPRRRQKFALAQDRTDKARAVEEKLVEKAREMEDLQAESAALRQQASEFLAESNFTANQLQARKDSETAAQERNALEARNMAEAVLKTAELQLKSARESKHPDPEIIANREKAVESAKAALAELVDPENA